jgi:integrase
MLTDAQLRSLKPSDKPRKVKDMGGMYVLVTPQGARLWRLSYRFQGKQKTLAMGSYPEVHLIEARERLNQAKRTLREGRDPGHEKKIAKLRQRVAADHTFGVIAEEWFERQKGRWAESYSARLRSRLDDDLLPELGSRPIASIEPLEVLNAIRKIEQRDAIEMAKRIMQMASAIFRYGIATGRCQTDPTRDLRGALRPPKPVKSRRALKAQDLPEFLRKMRQHSADRRTMIAMELTLLTLVRTQEVRFARWEEFEGLEGPNPIWRIPAERMKMLRPHLVPLPPQAVTLINELKEISPKSDWLFSAQTKSQVISQNTMLFSLYRMGYHGRATIHGFRKTGSTILNEGEWNPDWVELQLAHNEGGVRSIYNEAEWLSGRRTMMRCWADYLDEARMNNVVAMKGARSAGAA